MIISHKYEFIFVKTGKTAGTSIEAFLSKHCSPDDIVTPIYPALDDFLPRNYRDKRFPLLRELRIHFKRKRPQKVIKSIEQYLKRETFYNHIPAELIRNRIGEKLFDSYFKFTVVRNPWDKTLSHYSMSNSRLGGNLSFHKYVESDLFHLNYPLYTDHNQNIIVDEFVKYEDLNNGLASILDRFEIPFDGLGVKAKGTYREKMDYRDFFIGENEKYIELIARKYKEEIELFNYRF